MKYTNDSTKGGVAGAFAQHSIGQRRGVSTLEEELEQNRKWKIVFKIKCLYEFPVIKIALEPTLFFKSGV